MPILNLHHHPSFPLATTTTTTTSSSSSSSSVPMMPSSPHILTTANPSVPLASTISTGPSSPDTPDTPVLPSLLLLLPSIADEDPHLLANIYSVVGGAIGLVPRERQILHVVLPCMPATQSDQCRRILGLSVEHLITLAEVLETGLIIARNKGGPGTGGTDDTSYSFGSLASESPLDTNHDPDHDNPPKRQRIHDDGLSSSSSSTTIPRTMPPRPRLAPNPAYVALLSALSIDSVLPSPTPSTCASRRHSMATDLASRQSSTCAISGTNITSGAWIGAHLVPSSIASLREIQDTPYWLLLTLVFGQALRDTVFALVGGARAHGCINGIGFSSDYHDMFDNGRFWLLPTLTEPFDPATCAHYDATFRWRGNLRDLALRSTGLPVAPEDQIDYAGPEPVHRIPGLRNVRDGDVFRLFTTDPVMYPLPHPLLLQLHARLWNMLANSGLSRTGAEKARRMVELGVKSRRRGSRGGRSASESRGAGSGGGVRSRGHGRGRGSPGAADGGGENPQSRPGDSNKLNDHGLAMDNQTSGPLPLETEYLIFKLKVLEQEQQQWYADEDLWEGSDDDDRRLDSDEDMEYEYGYDDDDYEEDREEYGYVREAGAV